MKHRGKIIIWLLLLITLTLFILAKFQTNQTFVLTWLVASQLLSLLGVTLLSVSFLLSSRSRIVEDWCGGLDKVYKLHHLVGGLSFVLILNHPLFLVVNALPNTSLGFKYIWLSNILPYNFGVIGLYSMMLMLILTLFINLPYLIWKKTHELMGVALLFSVLHILTITSDVSRYVPLRFWIIFLLMIAVWSVIYKKFLYGVIGPKYLYVVDRVRKLDDVAEIYLKPTVKTMNYRAGQFAFVKFESLGEESHPYSIASGSNSNEIVFGIKALGDYTLGVKEIKPGDKAILYGPYGKFYEGSLVNKDLVWIAGGIGITPFLGLLDDEIKKNNGRSVDLFYCVRSSTEAHFDQEIKNKLVMTNSVRYHQFCSNDKGRLNANVILEMLGTFSNKKFMLCGPVPMMESLAAQLQKLGVKNGDILFEDFNFK